MVRTRTFGRDQSVVAMSLVAAVTLVMGLGVAAVASPDGERSAESSRLSTSTENLAAESYIDDTGAEPEVARAALRDQAILSEALTDYGDASAAWIEPLAGGRQVIHVDAAATELVAVLVEYRFEVTEVNVDASPHDLDIVDDELVEALQEVVPETTGVYVDPADGAVVIDVDPLHTAAGRLVTADADALENALGDAVGDELGGRDIRVVPSETVAGDAITIRGGSMMTRCTAGFVATTSQYRGFVTAAHCTTGQSLYSGPTSGSSVTATRRLSSNRQNADIAFWSVGASNALSKTIWRGGNIQTVSAPASVGTGTTVCSQGKATGWRCGAVTSIGFRPTWNDACTPYSTCNATFIRVSVRQAGGDSGGPWVLPTHYRSLGVHKGGSSTYSVYSTLNYTPSSVTVPY